jgi:hypothetical protein
MFAMPVPRSALPLQLSSILLLVCGWLMASSSRRISDLALILLWLFGGVLAGGAFWISRQGRLVAGALLGLNVLSLVFAGLAFWMSRQPMY